MSFTFQLVREDEDSPRAIVFEDSSTPGLVPVWEAAGVYDALYNSDGQLARDVSRRLAAWAAIFAVMTALAGIWGMNFQHMPELDWLYGYPAALGTMAVAVPLVYRRFRRLGWI